ncbi:hypothetical protein ACH5A3_21220 [Streptomyces echinatus]|uniref:hypothetical protein n=1 Tax=Streptomyces echinatus TaxID=67293 RepID=UPI0037AD24FA
MTYRYTDPDDDIIEIGPGLRDAATGQPILNTDSITITIQRRYDGQMATVYVPLDRVEELVAGIRDTARQAAAQEQHA